MTRATKARGTKTHKKTMAGPYAVTGERKVNVSMIAPPSKRASSGPLGG